MDSYPDRYGSLGYTGSGEQWYPSGVVLGLHPKRRAIAVAYAVLVTVGYGYRHPISVPLLFAYGYGIGHAYAWGCSLWRNMRVHTRGGGHD